MLNLNHLYKKFFDKGICPEHFKNKPLLSIKDKIKD